jgi:hypothetical protein
MFPAVAGQQQLWHRRTGSRSTRQSQKKEQDASCSLHIMPGP